MRLRLLLPSVAVPLFSLAVVASAWAQSGGNPQRGGELFVANCAVCHGVDGQGRIGASLESFPGINAGATLQATITSGVPGSVMPAWGQAKGGPLSDGDIQDIAAYILAAFGGTQPIQPLPTYVAPTLVSLPNVEGNPSAGAVVYQTNCVMCHGDKGQGRFGVPLAKAWPGNDPSAYIQQVVHQGIQGSVMPAWSQAGGGPLTDQEIANVAAFVLTLAPATSVTPVPPSTGPMGSTPTLLLLAGLAAVIVVILVVYYRRARTG
ncbi:MAG TPA: c-type cytochrome [Anaerolineales bacterium]|nr:c-type cytochrome [Anaerolineales bacterium]